MVGGARPTSGSGPGQGAGGPAGDPELLQQRYKEIQELKHQLMEYKRRLDDQTLVMQSTEQGLLQARQENREQAHEIEQLSKELTELRESGAQASGPDSRDDPPERRLSSRSLNESQPLEMIERMLREKDSLLAEKEAEVDHLHSALDSLRNVMATVNRKVAKYDELCKEQSIEIEDLKAKVKAGGFAGDLDGGSLPPSRGGDGSTMTAAAMATGRRSGSTLSRGGDSSVGISSTSGGSSGATGGTAGGGIGGGHAPMTPEMLVLKKQVSIHRRTAERYKRQVIQLTDETNQKYNELQNYLQANKQFVQELKLEYEEFVETSKADQAAFRSLHQTEYQRLSTEFENYKVLQYEDKRQLLNEQQALFHSMQQQFDEYRSTAEFLFQTETTKMERALNTQMEKYDQELHYVARAKDQLYDDMIAAKDAKIMSLVEGSNFQSLLQKHEMEILALRKSHRKDMDRMRVEMEAEVERAGEHLRSDIASRDSSIERLKQQIAAMERRVQDAQANELEKQRQLDGRDADVMKLQLQWQEQIDALLERVQRLTQEKGQLRHRILRMRSIESGKSDTSLQALVRRLDNDTQELQSKYASLTSDTNQTRDRNKVLNERVTRLAERNTVLQDDIARYRGEIRRVTKTFESFLTDRLRSSASGVSLGPSGGSFAALPIGMTATASGLLGTSAGAAASMRALPMASGAGAQQQQQKSHVPGRLITRATSAASIARGRAHGAWISVSPSTSMQRQSLFGRRAGSASTLQHRSSSVSTSALPRNNSSGSGGGGGSSPNLPARHLAAAGAVASRSILRQNMLARNASVSTMKQASAGMQSASVLPMEAELDRMRLEQGFTYLMDFKRTTHELGLVERRISAVQAKLEPIHGEEATAEKRGKPRPSSVASAGAVYRAKLYDKLASRQIQDATDELAERVYQQEQQPHLHPHQNHRRLDAHSLEDDVREYDAGKDLDVADSASSTAAASSTGVVGHKLRGQ